jgi:hypothetical protein
VQPSVVAVPEITAYGRGKIATFTRSRDPSSALNRSFDRLPRRRFMKIVKPLAVALFVLTAANVTYAAGGSGDILNWPDCPPGLPYAFSGDPQAAHFQTSPVAGPSGGTCSLDVVSGSEVIAAAGSSGGVAFATPGEIAGGTYTVAFDMQFVSGKQGWLFADESGSGDINGLFFAIPYPGDDCWHHYEYTAPLGAAGPKPILFVYQATPGAQEMRIDNMTIRPAELGAPTGLVSRRAENCLRCIGR